MPPRGKSKMRPEIRDRIYSWAYQTNPELSYEEIRGEIVREFGSKGPGFQIPALGTVGNEVREARNGRKPEDSPWSLGETVPGGMDAGSTKTVLDVWAFCVVRDYTLTIRHAKWVVRLSHAVNSASATGFGDLQVLYEWASLYAAREWVDIAQGRTIVSTSDLDAALILDRDTHEVLARAGKITQLDWLTRVRLEATAEQVEFESRGHPSDAVMPSVARRLREERRRWDQAVDFGSVPPFDRIDNIGMGPGNKHSRRREALELWHSWVTLLANSEGVDTNELLRRHDEPKFIGGSRVLEELAEEVVDWADRRQGSESGATPEFFEPSAALATRLGVRIEVDSSAPWLEGADMEIHSIRVHPL